LTGVTVTTGARWVVSAEVSFFEESATQAVKRSGKREAGRGKGEEGRGKSCRRDLSIGGMANVVERRYNESARS
jgi:hypothetical protein